MEIDKFIHKKPYLIAGPCSAESEEQLLETAHSIKEIADVFRAGIWKPRTKPNTFEGVGEKGLEWLQKIKKETGLKIKFAAHPKSLKKNRPKLPLDIDYSIGNTEELVKNSSLVLLHGSTAVSYAILFKKPTIFLTSYNLKKSWIGPRINNLAKVVNGQIINMDNDLNKPLDLQNLLKIDESKYKNYLDQYLKHFY